MKINRLKPSFYRAATLAAALFIVAPAVYAEAGATSVALAIPNALRPSPDLLVGGQPTPEHLEEAANAGFGTVINLRGPGEPGRWGEEEHAQKLGLDYVEIPIAGAADLTESNARALAEALSKAEEGAVMVHCASGNRVGALLALSAYFVDGADPEKALEQGRQAGLKPSLEGVVQKRMDEAAAAN